MKKLFAFVLLVLAWPAMGPAIAQDAPHWSEAELQTLLHWLEDAPRDGLETLAADERNVRGAMGSADAAQRDRVATAAAIRLIRAHRGECCGFARPANWHIGDNSVFPDAYGQLDAALAEDRLEELLRVSRPSHPYYLALRDAYANEADPARKATLALNMARWRWMPRNPGRRYLLVNPAAFEVTLWENGREVGRWPVIVGTPRTPTPIFTTNVQGVIFNPWWEIPTSIVAEGIGAMVRNNPAAAARRGYVYQNGRYRQRPGPGNALGLMKLDMPNPYSVFLHDTSARHRFAEDYRALSHGCIRVRDALGFASTLLGANAGWGGQAEVDRLIEAGETTRIGIDRPFPVYVGYFTAEPDGAGGVRYFDDIYNRD